MRATRFDGLPKWVQDRMLECQEEQGFKRDAEVFRKNIYATESKLGFSWDDTEEGYTNWNNAIEKRNYDGINETKLSQKKTKLKELLGEVLPTKTVEENLARKIIFQNFDNLDLYSLYILIEKDMPELKNRLNEIFD